MPIPTFLQKFFVIRISDENKKKPVLFSEFTDQFLEYSQSLYRPGTVWLYRRVEELFIEINGNMAIDKITALHWDKYQSSRFNQISPVTVNIELRTLYSILNRALLWKIIDHHPFARLSLCRIPEKYPDYFTEEEFQVFLNAKGKDWYKDVLQFAALTGMRRGEIINLKWKNVDLDKQTIQVVSSPTFKTKAGKKRIVPVHKRLIPILKKWYSCEPENYVFTHCGRKVKESYVTHRFTDYMIASGIQKKGLHFHSLRHTFASWLVKEGVPIYEVQKLLGHHNISTTEIYSHLQPCQLHKAVNKLQIFGK